MGKCIPSAPLREVTGMIDRKAGVVVRRKYYNRNGIGPVIEGKEEIFRTTKRDFKKKPAVGKEKANMMSFGQKSLEARRIIAQPESEEYKRWFEAWQKQLRKKTGKVYCRFDCFLVANIGGETE